MIPLPTRRLEFDLDATRLAWTPARPEFAYAANSVSLLMPYVEPYVVKSVRSALGDLTDEDLRTRTQGYLRQELSHHTQHRRFNDLLASQCRAIPRLERWMRTCYRWLERTRSRSFNLAFAAGAETVAYGCARWVDSHRSLLDGAQPGPAALFVWHLAEEVEHKTVAFEVCAAMAVPRRTYIAGMLSAFALLAWFTTIGTVAQLASTRRFFNPLAHLRLAAWATTLAFELLPTMLVSCLRGHHPGSLVDPLGYELWLRELELAPVPGVSHLAELDRTVVP